MYVSGTPRPAQERPLDLAAKAPIGGDGAGFGTAHEPPRVNPPPRPVVRRFPPVLQFLTEADALVQQQLWALAAQAHREGLTLPQICEELYHSARALGFEATLGVQEVYSAGMPSFPGQTVMSALLLVDLHRIPAPEGFHSGRSAPHGT